MESNDITPAQRHNAIVNFTLEFMPRMRSAAREGVSDHDAGSLIVEAIAGRFPLIEADQIHAAFVDVERRIHETVVEQAAVSAMEVGLNARCSALFHGLPADTTLEKAAKIKASKGDTFALYLIAHPHLLVRKLETDGGAA
ncbi:hypothetical protein QBK99_05360 [Corticibacterium sp. UT-5YL-CI-8]|nr:hypothetical protein [Tianweitania sp. UT-5YL-CI-8]